MARRIVVGVLSLIGFWHGAAAPSSAQQLLDDLYGQGVHAYYSGDLETSVRWLGEAIDQGTRDPRAFYFRGLAQLKLGQTEQAEADFAKGAAIETSGTDQFFPIADSLARVQGSARSKIEQARREARAMARDQAVTREKARYEATIAAESRVLRGSASEQAPSVAGSAPAGLQLPFPQEPIGTNSPFTFDALGDPFFGSDSELPEPAPVDPEMEEPGLDTTEPPAEFPVDSDEPLSVDEEMPAEETVPPAPNSKPSTGGVFGGLMRAFGRQVPNPAELIPGGIPIPGGPDLGGEAPMEEFDPNQPETPAGVDPFAPKR